METDERGKDCIGNALIRLAQRRKGIVGTKWNGEDEQRIAVEMSGPE